MFGARNPSRQISFFPLREVHPYTSEMSMSFSYYWVSGMKRLGGFSDRGLGLKRWLRVAVDGSNHFVGMGGRKGDRSRL
ncbi:hypothetical protein BHM03_00006454 [Ensete ventricosum]|uniref:Uncharacterized protein n=1 Tax=Ensete ventricosum TaxID=4639 RepID=A0A445MBR3_ENSVE|nr:hypothetical protein BHM03_00006454 [Ensete ventricosum]